MSFEYWFMFPVAILVATTAMASGVEGATFFTPIFLLVFKVVFSPGERFHPDCGSMKKFC